jgi:enoyl-CoA hydratase
MRLANRLVEPDAALDAALALARDIASRPQAALDRRSSHEQWSLPLEEALRNAYRHGMATPETGELLGRLERYAAGASGERLHVEEGRADKRYAG